MIFYHFLAFICYRLNNIYKLYKRGGRYNTEAFQKFSLESQSFKKLLKKVLKVFELQRKNH